MKKLIAVAVLATLCLTMLATIALADQTTVHFFHRWPNEPKLSYINGIIEEFEAANPDIDIVADCVLNDSYKEKIRVLVSTDDIPDLFFSWSGMFGENLVSSGRVLALDEMLAADPEYKAIINPAQLIPFQVDGVQYGIPWSMDGKVFFYNKDVFAELGLEVPTTYAELLTLCQTLKDNGYEEPISAGFKAEWAVSHYLGTICQRVVAPEVLSADYALKGDFSDPAYIRALEVFVELSQYMTEDPCSIDHQEARDAFIAGDSPMCYMQCGENKYVINDAEFEYSFFNFPAIEGGMGDAAEMTGGPEGWMLSSVSSPEVRDAATKFLKYLVSVHGGFEMTKQTGELSCVVGACNEENCNDKMLECVSLIMAASAPAQWQDCATEATVADAFMKGGQLMLIGDKTPADVMADVQAAAAAAK